MPHFKLSMSPGKVSKIPGLLFTLSLFCFFPFFAGAQTAYHPVAAKVTKGQSGTGENLDVKYHRFNWYLNPDSSKNIRGEVTTYFVTTMNKVKTIRFDLNKVSFDNPNLRVTYHGKTIKHSFPSSGNMNILNIHLPAALPGNRLDSLTIFYSGVPPAVSGEAEGFQQKTVKGSSTPMIYTLSESYEDKDWWPCKADMQDKIDSVDFIITTPADFRAAANGALIKEIAAGPFKTYYFKHRYPIASYLVAVAVAKYNVFDRGTVDIGGTLMPVTYYITTGRGTQPAIQLKAMDFVKLELVAFSEKFGDYPFKKEKYGMYEFGWGGGMEHQTFSAMGWPAMSNWGTIAHELMHQWFGNKVTFATWQHLWLAEGFARYGEALAAELIPSLEQSAVAERGHFKSAANGKRLSGFGCLPTPEFLENSTTLWTSGYGASVYERGAMAISMLRTLVGDEKFFLACRNFLNDPLLAYGSAVTDDLQRHFEAVLGGFDLEPFFDSWVKGNGYPDYSSTNAIKWSPAGNKSIVIGIAGQNKSSGSNVAYYFSPIPLRIQGAGGQDTLIVLYDQNQTVSIAGNGVSTPKAKPAEIYLGFEPVAVSFDPYNMGLATGEVEKQPLAVFGLLHHGKSKHLKNRTK